MTSQLAIVNGTVILEGELLEDAHVLCEGGRIVRVARGMRVPKAADVFDARGGFISPGFVDIHVHGGNGADFMDGTVAAVQTACLAHAKHGTTTIFPTTTTGSHEQILAMLSACRLAQQQGVAENLAGVHLYGPYFAEDKVGCHSKSGRREPLADEFNRYFAIGLVKIATCAAELPGAAAFYKAAKRRKCLITCGHSNASFAEMQRAFDAGMRHVDHYWCAMSSVPSLRQRFGVPMQASMAEFVLMQSEMSTEVIADGAHLAPELLEFAYRMIGPQRLCLVTDCNRALDLSPGKYRFGNDSDGSWFESDGNVGWAANGSLASSIVGMDHMVRHMKKVTSASLPEVVRMASLTPAQRVGIADETGSITVGKRADLVVLNRRLQVGKVFVRGVAT
jgi:N-acetylglucosamine-6-phosphate deacetylase